ncbi:MAG: hypothetical protein KDA84_06425 [Planctomycetaceae bacterium]|nr:hypothetical protein [Planctomycetaceae bacterium]
MLKYPSAENSLLRNGVSKMMIDLPDSQTLSEEAKETLRFQAIHTVECGDNETEVARIW